MRRLAFAACLVVASPALAAETLPARAPGLWESKSTSADGVTTAKQCVGEGTDAAAVSAMGGNRQCSKNEVTRTADGWSSETECKIGEITAVSRGTFSGDFKSEVRTELETTLTGLPGQSSPTPRKTVIEAKRLGDCEPGQKPGDIILSDGKVVRTPGAK